jgi:hypothetical protein
MYVAKPSPLELHVLVEPELCTGRPPFSITVSLYIH